MSSSPRKQWRSSMLHVQRPPNPDDGTVHLVANYVTTHDEIPALPVSPPSFQGHFLPFER